MGDKKKKGDQEEDLSTEQLLKIYKRRVDVNGVPLCKIFKERLDAAVSEGEHLKAVKLWEEMGPVGVRAMMEAFTEVGYKHLKELRLWRVKCQDEGVRTICIYIEKMKLLEVLDLLDNQIGVQGCKFLSNILHPQSENKLVKLKLDHNQFGTEGLAELAKGLAQNVTLEILSLKYCGIDCDGANFLQQILANLNSKLYKLKLSGNILKNKGAFELFRALEINETLEKIKLADNQFFSDQNDPQLIQKIVDTMKNNKCLGAYDLKFNLLDDADAQKIIQCVEANKSIYFIEISDQVSKPLTDKLKALTKKRKPKKKKKGKKKKK